MTTTLFFNYSLDCELPTDTPYTEGMERKPFFHGPTTWEVGEASVRGFVGQMDGLGVGPGTSLFVYPDVARHQKGLYCELADAGVEIALHLNGLRYSKLSGDKAKWLGAMTRSEQRDALRIAKEDLEQALGQPVTGYRACYGSANSDTQAICDELGFTWASNTSGRYRPEFAANWAGSWSFPHHASRHNNLICGDLNLFEIPVTSGLHVYYDEAIRQPLDLRVETPPDKLGVEREMLRAVVDEHVVEMEHRQVPVRTIIGASHNTNPFGQPETFQAQNLDWVVRHTRELADEHGMNVTPAPFARMRAEADRAGSY